MGRFCTSSHFDILSKCSTRSQILKHPVEGRLSTPEDRIFSDRGSLNVVFQEEIKRGPGKIVKCQPGRLT